MEQHAPTTDQPPRKRLRTKVFETGVGIAGFGGVLRAWRAEGNRLKNVATSLGKKAADMLAGTAISLSFKLVAITWVAGMIGGVSTWGMIGLLACATGAASAAYNFGKSLAGDKLRGPKDLRKAARVFDRQRIKKSGIAFAAGFAAGGLGLWLARTEIVQSALMWLRDVLRPLPLPIPAPLPVPQPQPEAAPDFAQKNLRPSFAAAAQGSLAANDHAAPVQTFKIKSLSI